MDRMDAEFLEDPVRRVFERDLAAAASRKATDLPLLECLGPELEVVLLEDSMRVLNYFRHRSHLVARHTRKVSTGEKQTQRGVSLHLEMSDSGSESGREDEVEDSAGQQVDRKGRKTVVVTPAVVKGPRGKPLPRASLAAGPARAALPLPALAVPREASDIVPSPGDSPWSLEARPPVAQQKQDADLAARKKKGSVAYMSKDAQRLAQKVSPGVHAGGIDARPRDAAAVAEGLASGPAAPKASDDAATLAKPRKGGLAPAGERDSSSLRQVAKRASAQKTTTGRTGKAPA